MADIQNLYFELRQSIDDDDINTTRSLLEQGADPNVMYDKNTPLLLHAASKNILLTKLLLKYGAEINSSDYNGTTLLDMMMAEKNFDMVRWLLKQGAIPGNLQTYINDVYLYRDHLPPDIKLAIGKLPDKSDTRGWVVDAIKHDNFERVKELLRLGVDIDKVSYRRDPPLIYAVRENKFSMVELLVANGADINLKNSDNKSAIDIATEIGDYYMVKWLWEHGAKVNSVYVLQMAMRKDYLMMKILILRGGDVNYFHYITALELTVRDDNIEETKWLLEHGAVFKTDYVIHEAIKNKNYELVDLLLEHVKKNKIELIGPLAAKAASAKQWLLAKKLIEYGYDINAHNTDNIYSRNFQSPILTLAASYSDIEFIRWLLQHGADVLHRDSMGRSAIDFATIFKKDDVVCLLLEYGAPLQYINYKADQEKYRQLCQHQPVKSLQQLAARSIARHQVNTSIIPSAVASDPEEVRRLELLMANDNKSRPLSFAI